MGFLLSPKRINPLHTVIALIFGLLHTHCGSYMMPAPTGTPLRLSQLDSLIVTSDTMPFLDKQKLCEILGHFPADAWHQKPITLQMYPDFESKWSATKNTIEYSYDRSTRTIHLVDMKLARLRLNEIIAAYIAELCYGEKYPRLTEGLAMLYCGTYYGMPLPWWDKKSALLGLTNKERLITTPENFENPFLYTILAVQFWQKHHDQVHLVFANPDSFIAKFEPALQVAPPAHVFPPDSIPYFKGVCFAHTNGVGSGYMSKQSRTSMRRLKDIGVDAISLTPFGYAKSTTEPRVHFVLDRHWDETLGGLFKAADDAHDLGIHVMMKPHIWVRGAWCGEIDIRDSTDRIAWENSYAQYATYQGLIAELAGMESMCIGLELPRMTRDTAMWKRIIHHVRIAYSGIITYGGNWFDEYEHIGFWDDLDFISIHAYFPLAHTVATPPDSSILMARQVAERLAVLSSQWKKPVAFTEVGFPSGTRGLISPHEEFDDAPADFDKQAFAYRTILETYQNKPWFKGYFWWKWESANSELKRFDKMLQFRGKPAERVLQEFYSR